MAASNMSDVAGKVEVARQGLADVLRIPIFGEGREADEIGEEDADQAGSAIAATGVGAAASGRWPAAGRVVAAPVWSAVPHSPQNRSPASTALPQFGQAEPRPAPHSTQKRRPGLFCAPQFEQSMPDEG
jgi:hypothetical protein